LPGNEAISFCCTLLHTPEEPQFNSVTEIFSGNREQNRRQPDGPVRVYQ
jgi:hypothetical protein